MVDALPPSPSPSTVMEYVRLAVVALVVSCTIAGSAGQSCKKFRDINDESYNCDTSCLPTSQVPETSTPVYGTEYYSEDCDICMAALHAGAVNRTGGTVNFKRHETSSVFRGTIRNRIVSKSRSNVSSGVAFKFHNNNPVISKEDLATDVIMVHNSYYEGKQLQLTCLSDDPGRELDSTNITAWDYSNTTYYKHVFRERKAGNSKCAFPFKYNGREYWECYPGKTGGEWCGTHPTVAPTRTGNSNWDWCTGPPGRYGINMKFKSGARAIRCLGRTSATDVLAVVQSSQQTYIAEKSTFRASQGQYLQVSMNKTGAHTEVYFRRLPDGWQYEDESSVSVTLPLTFNPVTQGDAGIYILGNTQIKKKLKNAAANIAKKGAYFYLIVRECEAGRYGRDCQFWCPDCENGGVCHAVTGSCLCAPGFHGPTCQQACDPGTFGSQCQLSCQKSTLGFNTMTDGECLGLTMCLPEPYGCSCAPGYTGPFCRIRCGKGWYGADCSQPCHYCSDNDCDPVSGTCKRSCKNDNLCSGKRPWDLPRLRTPPSVTVVNQTSVLVSFSAWTREKDDGSNNIIIISYRLQFQREDNDTWMDMKTLSAIVVSGLREELIEHLDPGYNYVMKVLLETVLGAADGSTNKRVHNVTFFTECVDPVAGNIEVEVTNHSAVVNWTDPGNHERCGILYQVQLINGTSKKIIQNEIILRPPFDLQNLKPDTQYNVTVIARKNGTGELFVISNVFSTLPNAPSQPVVSVMSAAVRRLNVSWVLPQDSSRADSYDVKYQLAKYKACDHPAAQQDWVILPVNNTNSVELEDLKSYATYNVCVTAKNTGGTSEETCSTASTLQEAPEVQVNNFNCTAENISTVCTGDLSNECETYNGQNISFIVAVSSFVECKNETLKSQKLATVSNRKISADINELVPGTEYNAILSVTNEVGTGMTLNTSFKTKKGIPPPVRNLTASALSSTQVRLFWNDPCPTHGNIIYFSYKTKTVSNFTRYNISNSKCTNTDVFDRCVDITNLEPHKNYTFVVSATNGEGRSVVTEVWAVTNETEPGPPESLNVTSYAERLHFSLSLPAKPGGVLLSFTIVLQHTDYKCGEKLQPDSYQQPTCEISGLKRGKRFRVEAHYCNSAGCGMTLNRMVATLPIPPKFKGELTVKTKTNTNVTLGLPSIEMNGDGERSLAILAHHLHEGKQVSTIKSYKDEYLRHRNKQKRLMSASEAVRSRRQTSDQDCAKDNPFVAAVISPDLDEFVVGDGKTDGTYQNCQLKTNEHYMIAVVAEIYLEGNSEYEEMKLPIPVLVKEDSGVAVAVTVSILVLLMLLLLVVFVLLYKRRRKPQNKAGAKFWKGKRAVEVYDNGRVAPDQYGHSVPNILATPQDQRYSPRSQRNVTPVPDSLPPLSGDVYTGSDLSPPPDDDANIYENIFSKDEDIYANISRRIPHDGIEAYLNKAIGSHDIMEEFTSIPSNVGKSMSDGERPENKKKNRYRNNLPYDDTRVKLSIINDDPFSNYINASHVYGFGGVLKYIASQGPKDANVNTIGDFWRMIREQHISVIVMVANFVEGGKRKVGQYINFGESLEVDGYVVEVIKTDQHSHYNVSLVQVWKNGVAHTVTHYHYTSWPDHDVPSEAHSLGTMIRQIIQTHSEGGVVAHCSAGIGRTGTVLMVMLLHEMLMIHDSIDPLEVLKHLRECRARLVENVAQYNLALQIFDEVLFGAKTVISSFSLQDQTKEFLKSSSALYQKAMALPSGLTFRGASQREFYPQNRNHSILPADTQRIFLEMENGKMLSQYINAVRLNGLDHPNTMVATEHPLPSTLAKFWRLVVEKKCPNVVLINTYEGYEKEFPEVLPRKDADLILGTYTIHTLHAAQYNSFVIYSIEIISQNQVHHTVTVYQITSWPYGSEVPPSPDALVGVSELLLQTPYTPETGPLVLCCGDGVTGCGLMAGVLLTIEKLQKYNEIDVYRTVVYLQRARPQFFVSQAQFELLYSAAVTFLQDYDTYVNCPR